MSYSHVPDRASIPNDSIHVMATPLPESSQPSTPLRSGSHNLAPPRTSLDHDKAYRLDGSHSDTSIDDHERDKELEHNGIPGQRPANAETSRDVEKQEGPPQKPKEQERDLNVIEWDGPDDPENPMNFKPAKKWTMTVLFGLITFVITFASSVFSTATVPTAKLFNVSPEVMVLGTALFVLGFSVGPPVWGPLSELYGRKAPMLIGYVTFAIFQIPVAVAQNIETVMLCRFLGGVFGSAPLAIIGGTLADFWNPVDRGVAIAIFAASTFLGPVCGPIIGSFVTQSHLGWRWTAWLTLIMASTMSLVHLIFIPETFGPVLLQRRARKIRHETKNWAIRSKLDESPLTMSSIVSKYLKRPFEMLFMEPILDLITLYMALIYGIIYLFFEAYPIAFIEVRGWSPGLASLPFLAITIGVILGGLMIAYTSKTRVARKLKETGRIVPEERLIPIIFGGAVFPIGMFWFAWTSHPGTSWVPQVLAGIPIGMGILLIFLQGLNYIIDVYTMNANSAIAANTFVRSLFGAAFPVFATGM